MGRCNSERARRRSARVTRHVTLRRTIEREINEALTRVTEIVAPPEDEQLGSEDE